MDILIATGNAGKLLEIQEFFGDMPGIRFLSLKDLGLKNDCEETGNSFAENALQKAKYFFERAGIPTLGEDSGIIVDALTGELGIKTRRWGAGEKATDEEWLAYFLQRMAGEKIRSARFFCASVFYDGEKTFLAEGQSEGNLLQNPVLPIPKGIPLSALFVPVGHEKVFSAMTRAEKNSISHRGSAIGKMKEWLEGQKN
ncbi:MAG: non-canonical purine NTP pyrophosphatase [Candidatus Peregrinibacteria bacterium]